MSNLEDVKKILRSLLVSSPTRVTIQSLVKDFNELEGYNIPYKELGFNSLTHLLHSIPDVLKLNGTSNNAEVSLVVSEKTAHVNDLVMKQRIPTNRKIKTRKSVVLTGKRSLPNNQKSIQSGHRNRDRNRASISHSSRPPLLPTPQVISTELRHNYMQLNPVIPLSPFPRPLLIYNNNDLPKLTNHVQNKTRETGTKPRSELKVVQSAMFNVQNKSNENELVETKPKSELKVTQSALEKLRMRKLGRNINNTDASHFENLSVTLSKETNEVIIGGNESKIPRYVQNNLHNLIMQYPDGIWCADVPSKYRKLFGEEIDYLKYGFLSLINLCLTLENIIHCRKESTYDYKLYSKTRKIPKLQTSIEIDDLQSIIDALIIDPFAIKPIKTRDSDEFSNLFPENVLKQGDVVRNNTMDDLSVGCEKSVVISEILSPSKFWMHKEDRKLDVLMKDMQRFYSDNKAKYLIPEILVEVGLYCVVHSLNEFYRGIVVEPIKHYGHVRVYFIDFGSLAVIPKSKIWFLTKEFAELPYQGIPAYLADIKAIKDDWTIESTTKFKNFIEDKHVVAKITQKGENIFGVYIADVKHPLKSVNDHLVAEGVAQFVDKENETAIVDKESDRKKGMLNFLERLKMRKQNCDSNNN